jgi:hypothetical protein
MGTEGALPWLLLLIFIVLPVAIIIFGVAAVIRHWRD